MKSIEILINSMGNEKRLLIDIKNERIIINNKIKIIKKERIDELLRIIRLWNNEYGESNEIDLERFLIKINMGNKVEIIKGQGRYPVNYQNLKDWIGEFDE